MRRIAILIAAATLLAPAGALASDPIQNCGIVSCVSADAHAELDCSSRPGSCSAALTWAVELDSPVPVESMDYTVTFTCAEAGCSVPADIDASCGWVPGEVRPPGETGCSVGQSEPVQFTYDVPAGSCASYQIGVQVDVRSTLDPFPQFTRGSTAETDVCP